MGKTQIDGDQVKDGTIRSADLDTTGSYTMGTLNVGEYIYHTDDGDTYIQFSDDEVQIAAGGRTFVKIEEASTDKITINHGALDIDLQVKGENVANLIRTDAANDRVGFGTSSPAALIHATGSFVLAAPNSGSHPAVANMNNGEFTFFYESSTLKVSMKVNGSEMTGSVASLTQIGGSSYSAANLYGQSSYSSGGSSGYSMGMNACSAASSDAGTNQSWYRNTAGTQVYEDSSGNTAVSLSSGGYFYLENDGSNYRFYISTSGVVYESNGGSSTNLDSTSYNVRCS